MLTDKEKSEKCAHRLKGWHYTDILEWQQLGGMVHPRCFWMLLWTNPSLSWEGERAEVEVGPGAVFHLGRV